MSSLEEENAKLKAENKRLRDNLEKLEKEKEDFQSKYIRINGIFDIYKAYVKDLQENYGSIIPPIAKPMQTAVFLDSIKYENKYKPIMRINNTSISFESTNDKTAKLAEAICKPSHLKKIYKQSASIPEIYDWLNNDKEWFNLDAKERRAFGNQLYQWFRQINNKIKPILNNRDLFKKANKEYKFNDEVKIVETSKD